MDTRRELVLLICSAILGSAASYVISGIGAGFRWPIFAILLLVLALVLSRLGPLPLILRRPGSTRLNGDEWKFTYSYTKPEGDVSVSGRMRIRQYGSFLRGHGWSTRVDGPTQAESFEFDWTGEIHAGRIVSGTFVDVIAGRGHWGVFQARVNEMGTRVEALWVGKGHEEIHSGPWTWTRPTPEMRRRRLKKKGGS